MVPPVAARIRAMPKILFLTAYPIEDASCRYRVHQFIPHLERANYECTVSSFCSPELFAALKNSGGMRLKIAEMARCSARRFARIRKLEAFDLIVIHREAYPFLAPWIENRIFRRHSRVVFSFDDAIYAGHGELRSLNHPWLYRWKHGHKYDEVIRRSRLVIAGNRILAEYAGRLNPNVAVVPTVVDCGNYLPRKMEQPSSRPLRIGWMGSPSTSSHLQIVEPALRRLAYTYPGQVEFGFFGNPSYSPDFPYSKSQPFRLDSEISDLQSLDVGLMPLRDSEWARGKCAFKAIQYMASGIPVVASPVGITCDLIQHGTNGLLADSPEEWFSQLERLLLDAALRAHLGAAGRRTVEQSYSLETWAPKLVAIFDRLLVPSRELDQQQVAA